MKRLVVAIAAFVGLSGCRTDMENTTAPPGDPSAFAPFSQVAAAAAYAGRDAKLISIDVRRVPASGTIRLSGEQPAAVTYEFVATDSDGNRVRVAVDVCGAHDTNEWHDDAKTPKRHLGMQSRPSPLFAFNQQLTEASATAPPACSAADLWKKAIASGAPADVDASIHYDAQGYRFAVIRPTGPMLSFDRQCNLMR
jgi:uncharacterized protein YceK